MYWANFLHFYQPPTQKKEILDRVVKECYRPVFEGFSKLPRARLTINFSSCLTELLARNGYEDVIKIISHLMINDQIELTVSAKYHPLLPKIPEQEIVRQIGLDMETNEKYFGKAAYAKATAGKGFFPPEMAFNLELAKIIAGLGLKWIVVDEMSYPGTCHWDKVYKIEGLPFGIYFRERDISFKLLSAQLGTERMVVNQLGEKYQKDRYLLTGMDGETFGHHRPGLENLLFEMYEAKSFDGIKISDLQKHFLEEEIIPRASTWSLMERDLVKDMPFNRWDDPENEIHAMQWKLTRLALKSVEGQGESPERHLFDQAIHSDQYWWAGAKPWWSIELIEAGAKQLKDVVNLSNKSTDADKKEANDLYVNILITSYEWQRSGKVEKMARSEDEELRQMNEPNIRPEEQKEEIKEMIKRIEKQMLGAAEHKEYERAALLRNRIKELEGYLKNNPVSK